MSYDYSNYTLFGIKDAGERLALGGWQIFVILCSLFGDTTILVASMKYKAFKLHTIIVVFIQHIAVCDLLISLFNAIPNCVSVISNSDIPSLKYARAFSGYFLFTVCSFLVGAMTLGKLLLLKYPLKTGCWSTREAHKLCAGIWIFSTFTPILQLVVDKDDIIFDFRVYSTMKKYSSAVWKILSPIVTLLIFSAPNTVIIVSTILLLKEARKVATGSRESLRWQGIITVVLTATVYTISFLPFAVYRMLEPFVEKDASVPGPFYLEFYRVACASLYFNVLSNFLIYSLSVTSFRRFLKTRFRLTAQFFFDTSSSQGNDYNIFHL